MTFKKKLAIIYLEEVIYMIHGLSTIIANYLSSKKVIPEDETEAYIYGYETFLSGIIDLIITLIFGIVFKRILVSILFFMMFVAIRMYVGGYHANSYFKCKLIFISNVMIALGASYIRVPLLIIIIIIAIFLITMFIFSLLENLNKPLSAEKRKKYRIIGLLYSVIWSIASIITYFNRTDISMMIICGELIITLLMLYGILVKEGKEDEKEFYS